MKLSVLASMLRQATVEKCRKQDIDPDRPKTEQVWCLYTAHGEKRLLGRHASQESAYKQEAAIHAKGG